MTKFITIGKINTILFIVLVISFAVVLFVPVKPLEIKGVVIHGDSFKAGGELTFTIDRCKNVDASVSGTASRYFVDIDNQEKQPQFISSTDDLGEKGCGEVTRTIDIPSHIKDGHYKLKFVTRYFPSVLREPVKVEYTSKQSFFVKGQELSAQLSNILAELQTLDVSQPANVPAPSTTPRTNQKADAVPQAQVTQPPVVNPTVPAPQAEQENQSLLNGIIDATQGLINSLPVVGGR